jgi:hypothetical protein
LANIINGTDTGSGGLITTGDSSDELQLQTAEVARVTLTNTAVVVNESGADVDFRVESDTVENALFVDGATGNVGVGATPSFSVDVVRSGGDAQLRLMSQATGTNGIIFRNNAAPTSGKGAILYPNGSAAGGDTMQFVVDNAERMRIDSSGNLLVGKTSTAAGAGVELRPDGQIVAYRSGNRVAYFDRLTSDGSIIEFHKDNIEVGSIGTTGGELYIDFGGSTGGAVTSRTLDDYEEGTFTPAFSSSGAVFAYTVQQGAYTKIGRQVCFNIYLQLDGAQTLTANFVTITGLPFTSATISNLNVAMVCGIRLVNLTAGASILVGRLGSNSSSISLVEEGDNYATTSLNSNQLSNLSGQVMISGTYPAT